MATKLNVVNGVLLVDKKNLSLELKKVLIQKKNLFLYVLWVVRRVVSYWMFM